MAQNHRMISPGIESFTNRLLANRAMIFSRSYSEETHFVVTMTMLVLYYLSQFMGLPALFFSSLGETVIVFQLWQHWACLLLGHWCPIFISFIIWVDRHGNPNTNDRDHLVRSGWVIMIPGWLTKLLRIAPLLGVFGAWPNCLISFVSQSELIFRAKYSCAWGKGITTIYMTAMEVAVNQTVQKREQMWMV